MREFVSILRDIEARFRVLSQEINKETATLNQSVADTLRDYINQTTREISEITSNLEYRQTMFETTHGDYYNRYAEQVCTTLRSIAEELKIKVESVGNQCGEATKTTKEELEKLCRDVKRLEETYINNSDGVKDFTVSLSTDNKPEVGSDPPGGLVQYFTRRYFAKITLNSGKELGIEIPFTVETSHGGTDGSTRPISAGAFYSALNQLNERINNIVITGGVKIDNTLTISGAAADAAVTGTKIHILTNAVAEKLDKSGGTMTGEIVFPADNKNAGIANDSGVRLFGYGSVDGNTYMIIGDTSTPLQFRGDGTPPKYNNDTLVLRSELETALGAYITDIDTLVGGGE